MKLQWDKILKEMDNIFQSEKSCESCENEMIGDIEINFCDFSGFYLKCKFEKFLSE